MVTSVASMFFSRTRSRRNPIHSLQLASAPGSTRGATNPPNNSALRAVIRKLITNRRAA
ncbi:hypothetical protein HQO12_16565 [Rhodococcus fascians]|uniref:hypothetical protein n=1 Tax=Rhodococcoides fascians TaxID=1828 RepID=UPI001960376F|nr:hypothetical protein [Rhodococcus fascians]MBY3810520.1 hypothetical protein [Rhodococcus fascians]MBY3841857.1 hypothetical protein [Rhodococcus fascians]MBY3844308.1 hypothetical protein [Rhodococcus fascians]MBY3850254.1 hypothetical protein [Rhodococcus fascians]MBY3854513.1 hypothetical protein [Rhodococcus fascians]